MKLIKLKNEDIKEFENLMIESFQNGFESYTKKKEEQVLPVSDIEESLKYGDAYEMIDDDKKIIGGVIVNIDNVTNINHLDFLFVRVGKESKGIGAAIWDEVEHLYPKTKIWVTCTPYFDERNIHFYVNKLNFHITKFYNKYFPDPNMPLDFRGDNGEGMFEFEKVMK